MLIGEIEKNSLQKIMVTSETYKGHDFVDVRVYYRNEAEDDYKPSKKGIAIAPYKIEVLIALLKKARETL